MSNKCCETGPTVYRSLSETSRESNHLADVITKAALSSSVIFKTLSVGPAGVWTRNLPHGSPVLYQLS